MRVLRFAVVMCAALAPSWAQSRIYLVCEKAGATPVAALAEQKPGGQLAVLSSSDGAPGSCQGKSVAEVRAAETPAAAQAAPGGRPSGPSPQGPSGGQPRPGGPPPAQAGLVGGALPGGAILSSAISAALAAGSVPVVDADSPRLPPATRSAVSNVLKTKHDTVKNSINNVR
jgi:hypothetical protein